MRQCNSLWLWLHLNFNPRTPYGMRLESCNRMNSLMVISIHAPLTGCDNKNTPIIYFLFIFQSTHPLRDATYVYHICYNGYIISIHAPLTGCDYVDNYEQEIIKISIHAPLTGCDACKFVFLLNWITISIHAPLTGCDSTTVIYKS